MKIPPRNLEAFVKAPPAEVLSVLVYGPDEGLVRERMNLLTKTVVSDLSDPFNIADITPEQLAENPARLLDEIMSISMLGGRRVVRLRDAGDAAEKAVSHALECLNGGDNFLLISAGNLGKNSKLRLLFEKAENAAALPCYVDDARDLGRVIGDSLRAQGYRIAPDALSYMADSVIGDRGAARSEAEKLVLYMGKENRNIALSDVEAALGNGGVLTTDHLAQGIAQGDAADADRALRFLLSEGVSAVAILRNLQNYYTRLHITRARIDKGENPEAAMKKLRPEVFFKYKPAFERLLSLKTQDQIEQVLSLLVSAEARCKQSGADPDLVAGRAVMTLSRMMTPERRRA